MILECPSCNARYMVKIGDFVQAGREVRCARCQHAWHADLTNPQDLKAGTGDIPPIPADLGKPQRVGADSASSNLPKERSLREMLADLPASRDLAPESQKTAKKLIKWNEIGFFFSLSGLFLVWIILDREPIVKVFPFLRPSYDAIGLHIAPAWEGLIFDKVKARQFYDAGAMKLVIDGVVYNSNDAMEFVPDIKAGVRSPDRQLIQSWWIDAPQATIKAGGTVPFHTEVNVQTGRTIDDISLEFFYREDRANAGQ